MIIGISGPSGSGKTSVARALCQIIALQPTFKHKVRILHQDDFYKPEHLLPFKDTPAGKVVNWDCPAALDMEAFAAALAYYKDHGQFSEEQDRDLDARAKEDMNEKTDFASAAELEAIGSRLIMTDITENVLIVDGFMLFHENSLLQMMDLAILLRGSFETLRARREARSGYVTIEGFWKDPEGYFEHVVYPEYIATHQHLFVNKDVDQEIESSNSVVCSSKLDMTLIESLQFVIDTVNDRLRR